MNTHITATMLYNLVKCPNKVYLDLYGDVYNKDPIKHSGRILTDGLLNIPDLLRVEEGGKITDDIKSGTGIEGSSDMENKKTKEHYIAQIW